VFFFSVKPLFFTNGSDFLDKVGDDEVEIEVLYEFIKFDCVN
jgi:hypothetical protein